MTERILLVDDDEDIATLVRDLFTRTHPDWFFHWVSTFEEGLAALHEPWSVALVDYQLGRSTGVEMIAAARDVRELPPVIMVTSHSEADVDRLALAAGAVDFVDKASLGSNTLERATRYAIERRGLEDRLREAVKMESVGQLAGGVAHDFNNLLAVIQGHGEVMLVDEDLSARARKQLTTILESAERAAGLTRQLLAFSRQQFLTVAPYSISDVLDAMLDSMRSLVGTDIELVVKSEATHDVVMVDRSQLEQVLVNLATNAGEAMPDGGIITLHVSDVDSSVSPTNPHGAGDPMADPGFIELVVSDSGSGIAPELLPKVFEPFYSTKSFGQGSGLGLSTVFGIIKQSGGRITAESPGAGLGATFRLVLPRAGDHASDSEPASSIAATELPNEQDSLNVPSETVFVVDDEASVLGLVEMILVRAGYEVRSFAEAGEALDAIRTGHLDLLVSDVMMPVVSGPQLAREAIALRPGLPVLLMSGYSRQLLETEHELPHGVALIAKPFALDELVGRVKGMIGPA